MTKNAVSERIFFEITDIVLHVYQGNSRVTGIQRVQLNLIRLIAAKQGAERVRCAFYHPRQRAMVEFDPGKLFTAGEFNGERALLQLGVMDGWRRLPTKSGIRRYLRPWAKSKILRVWKKIDLYVSALLLPSRLKQMGLVSIGELSKNAPAVEVHTLPALSSADSLVFLGGNWLLPQLCDFARAHAAQKGDVVQLLYDVIPLLHPEYCTPVAAANFSHWLVMTQDCVSRFICISQSTARDLLSVDFVRARSPKAIVVPLAHEFDGYQRNAAVPGDILKSFHAPHGFVLCVGTLEIRKNGVALLRAWLRLHDELGVQLPKLVFAGKRGWLMEEFDRLLSDHPVLQELVIVMDAPTDQDLAALYAASLFTVYPSLYEGWGLPVGEAAWFGKYCITANNSSLPEVCGDLVDYIGAEDEQGLVKALRQAIVDENFLRHREFRIKSAMLRSWEQVADDVWSALALRE